MTSRNIKNSWPRSLQIFLQSELLPGEMKKKTKKFNEPIRGLFTPTVKITVFICDIPYELIELISKQLKNRWIDFY